MEMHRPFRIISPTVDGDVLVVLAGADTDFTAPQVHALIGSYTVEGVRRALHRLTAQGIVTANRPSRAALYRLNRVHLGADAVLAIAAIRPRLLLALRQRLDEWDPAPEFAALFGSAATGTMRPDSDIDLFFVRPGTVDPDLPAWTSQVDAISRDVTAWTGNDTRVLEYESGEVSKGRVVGDPVLNDILADGVMLHGSPSYLRRAGAK